MERQLRFAQKITNNIAKMKNSNKTGTALLITVEPGCVNVKMDTTTKIIIGLLPVLSFSWDMSIKEGTNS
jgi:hypothetical protein